jgi:3-oxoacyl-[acyl-carrier-protein] synthase II
MAFINGIGIISAQGTGEPGFLDEPRESVSDYLKAIDPDYKQYINPIASRRMSRLIKMGITSARAALADAGCEMPDAIITGTGLGSVEDTEKLLAEINTAQNIVNPTPFIQSTYNTISSQIAINLKCHNYNSTYVHRSFSIESALQDGLSQIEEGMAANVLAGGIDELTLIHLNIIRRMNHWKMMPVSNFRLREYDSPGALAGEGSAYFVMGNEKRSSTYCSLKGVRTLYDPQGPEEIAGVLRDFLSSMHLGPDDVSFLLAGYNGDREYDPVYDQVRELVFPSTPVGWFKHLSGEYYTCTGFGCWVASNILKRQEVPEAVIHNLVPPREIRNILVYNQYRMKNQSLMLLSRV